MSKRKRRVYVAAAISKGPLDENCRLAFRVGMELLRAGYAPFVPHGSCFWGCVQDGSGFVPEVLPADTVHADWMGIDLPWVEVAEAVLRLPGESVGADLEVQHAIRAGIPVFYSLETLYRAFPA